MRLSVCIATYNGARFLREQLDSILSQVQAMDEVLVADDCSTDNTQNVIVEYLGRVSLVCCDRVGSPVYNFERVLLAARGDGIVLCDQDDVWLPGRLDMIREHLQSADLVLLNGLVVDGGLRPLGGSVFEFIRVRPGFLSNLWKNSFIGCGMAFRKSSFLWAFPFPKNLPWHDWYLGLLAELTGQVVRIDTPTFLYRRHGGNFSPTGERSTNSVSMKLLFRLQILKAIFIALSRKLIKKWKVEGTNE